MKNLKIKFLDVLCAVVFVAVIVCSIFYAAGGKSTGAGNLVITSGSSEYIYPMDKNLVVEVSGKIGKTVVQIKNGQAFISDSPCPNKTCMQCKPISGSMNVISCLPNGIFLRVEKVDDSTPDALSY